MIKAIGLAHAVITVTNLEVTKEFYEELLEIKLEFDSPQSLNLLKANIPIWFIEWDDTNPDDSFDETRVGLDHIAIEVASEEDLWYIADRLKHMEIESNGVEYFQDKYPYVAFRDPDNIQTEFFVNTPKE